MKKNNVKYLGYMILFALMPVCFISGILVTLNTYPNIPFYVYILITAGVVLVLFNPRITRKFNSLRYEREYDEFGRHKGMSDYMSLSKSERREIDKQKLADMERVLNSSALKKLIHSGSKDPDADLNTMVGLSSLKKGIRVMATRIEFDKSRTKGKNKGSTFTDCKHFVFYGAPGTGKTTVARILAGYLYKYHLISQNKVIEVDGNYLKSSNAADTALKTELILREAYGGVLFIDEAYSLNYDGQGQTAIVTLLKAMEDNRSRFVLIISGYDKEIEQLLSSNPGFKSRFNEFMHFPNYSNEELKQIFEKMANANGMCVSQDATEQFERVISKLKNTPGYANGRTVRTIVDKAISMHSYRINIGEVDGKDKYYLTSKDLTDQSF